MINEKNSKNVQSKKYLVLLGMFLVLTINCTIVFGLTELERVTISNTELENAFGAPIENKINVSHKIQISTEIKNNQQKSQTFIYFVQIKNQNGFVSSLSWISGQLTPGQKLSPSLSWIPKDSGEFTAEIFIWEGLENHKALDDYATLQIHVS